jgi:hypothetical protein
MKLFRIMSAMTFIFYSLSTVAQTSTRLVLSNQYPKVGEELTFTYYFDGSNIDSRSLQATIFFLSNDQFPVIDADLKREGKLLKGEFMIPEDATAFCIKVSDGETMDNSDSYLYLVYNNNVPVKGAYANEAEAVGLFSGLFGLKKNMERSASLYKQEFDRYPDLESAYEDNYLLTLFYSNAEDQQVAYRRANVLAESNWEKNMISALNYYRHSKKIAQADSLLNVIKEKFPDGEESKIELTSAFDNEHNILKKDSLYEVLMTRYPAMDKSTVAERDYKRIQLATAHLKEGDINGFMKWERQIKNKYSLPGSINSVAMIWVA